MNYIGMYLKTTETCNLNCSHCFTNGINGPKIYWDHHKVADWLKRLAEKTPDTGQVHCEFHGGEPFLAPVSTMQYVFDQCNGLWPSMSWGVTTNLTFKLTDEMIEFMEGPLQGRVGTSWDPNIRFANEKQLQLWEKNVKTLVDRGFYITLFVSMSKDLIKKDPLELFEYVKRLGVQELSLERLTKDGSAVKNPDIFPTNIEQDAWFLRMAEVAPEFNEYFANTFLETVHDKFKGGNIRAGTFCRDCEEKLFTVNATGTIAGCPNSAPEKAFGSIDDDVSLLLNSPTRIDNIACERHINTACIECDVFAFCGGDCHQLEWDGDICGAPKSLMRQLSTTKTNNKKVFRIKEI